MRKPQVLIVFTLMLAVASCAGIKAREEISLSQIVEVWPDIKAECELGLSDVTDLADKAVMKQRIEDFDRVIKAKDPMLTSFNVLLTQWPSMRTLAMAGVNRRVLNGQLKAAGSKLGVERIDRFQALLTQLVSRNS